MPALYKSGTTADSLNRVKTTGATWSTLICCNFGPFTNPKMPGFEIKHTVIAALAVLIATGCSDSESEIGAESGCSRVDLAVELDDRLERLNTDAPFSLYVEDLQGLSYLYSRNGSSLWTEYESASTSKWVSAAAILRLVDGGYLSLNDHPQMHLSSQTWPIPAEDPLTDITLGQLLSFTSGLKTDALCVHAPDADFFECVTAIAARNIGNGAVPGEAFHYGNSHLQVAGAMAVRAAGFEDWQALFDNFQAATQLFPSSEYDLPSTGNPRLAGGMHWTGRDYLNFIRAFRDSTFYSSAAMTDATVTDRTADAVIVESPAFSRLGEEWHYGYGVWIECHHASFRSECGIEPTVSSPGAYGAYPFLNYEEGYFGIVARQGDLGTFREGYEVFDSVRELVEDWVACDKP